MCLQSPKMFFVLVAYIQPHMGLRIRILLSGIKVVRFALTNVPHYVWIKKVAIQHLCFLLNVFGKNH